MARNVVLNARLCSFEHSAYESFTDSSGRLVNAGVSHRLWVVDDHAAAPLRIDVQGDDVAKLAALDDPASFGQQLAFTCQVFANGRRLRYKLVSVEAAGVRASKTA